MVLNRASLDGEATRSYCEARGLPILQEIPDDRNIAEAYARGDLVCEALPQFESMFLDLLESTCATVRAAG